MELKTWTFRKINQKYLERSVMWYWGMMEKISSKESVRNEEVLHKDKEERNSLHTVKRRKTD